MCVYVNMYCTCIPLYRNDCIYSSCPVLSESAKEGGREGKTHREKKRDGGGAKLRGREREREARERKVVFLSGYFVISPSLFSIREN